MNKIKLLALCDYCCSTGFATVSSNIMQQLQKSGKYDITVVGINYNGDPYDKDRFPGKVFPAINVLSSDGDVYGRQRFLDLLGTGQFDLAFIIQDTFIVQTIMEPLLDTQKQLEKKFATIFYYPIDATPKKEWIEQCVNLVDFPVPYTNYASKESVKAFPEVKNKLLEPIYHGTNLSDFFYVANRPEVAKFRNKYFMGKADGKFLITNVNRNQPRKDVIRSMMILKELRSRGHDNAVLYMHMAHDDAGGNLLVMADHFGFKVGEDILIPSPRAFNVNQGLPVGVINLLYNASDVVLSTTLGEGWGLSITEAMVTRTPVVAPDNTSLHEMLADNRGALVASGAGKSDWFSLGASDNERLRPLMDVTEAANAIENIKYGKLPDIDGALEWAQSHSWENICKQWQVVFDKAYASVKSMLKTVDTDGLNRQQRRAMERKAKKVAL